jgi:hypothetical protein
VIEVPLRSVKEIRERIKKLKNTLSAMETEETRGPFGGFVIGISKLEIKHKIEELRWVLKERGEKRG